MLQRKTDNGWLGVLLGAMIFVSIGVAVLVTLIGG